MAYRIDVTDRANAEADDAYEWIARDSPEAAERWYRGLFAAFETLTENPQRCPLAPDDEAFGCEVRQLLYGKRRGVYRILFTITEDAVQILRIRHAARRFLNE